MARLAAVLVTFLAAGTAAAQSPAGAGPYAGIGGSAAFEEFDLPSGVSADDSFALDLIAGYRVNSAVALEAEAEFLSGFDLDGLGGDIDGLSLTGSAKLFPIEPTEAFQPFLLLGLGILDLDGPGVIDADDSDWMLQIGGGVDFLIAERTILEVDANYHFPQGDLDDFEYWTLGANVQFRF